MAKKPELKFTVGTWDWKDSPDADELAELLAPFGVTVTAHPACEGSDSYGFIFSDRPLTKAELKEATNEV